MKKKNLPKPAIIRLCTLYQLLDNLSTKEKRRRISSSEMGMLLGVGAHNIRKDVNYLGEIGTIGSGYDIVKLKEHIYRKLQLNVYRNACVVGLGRLGTAVLNYEEFSKTEFRIVAAFDSSVNRLETIRTDIELYPAYEITEVCMRKKIELGVLAVPASAAQDAADRLIEGGVRGIVNFSPAVIQHTSSRVFITNMDVVREFSILSALMMQGRKD